MLRHDIAKNMATRGVVGYLAAEGFLPELRQELERSDAGLNPQSPQSPLNLLGLLGRLALCSGPAREAAWARNIWHDPQLIGFDSIAQAATALKGLGPRWALYDEHLERRGRAKLIQERLPGPSAKPVVFGAPVPTSPLGSWTLLDDRTLLASPRCSSPFAHGEIRFAEDKTGPPSRAYLKLWETFTLLDRRPEPGQLCLDLGSSPGGWTWVLQKIGARVISIDKARLAPDVVGLPGVEFRTGSAFAQRPEDIGPVDWLFSDVVCYPRRLLDLVRRWLDSGLAGNMICTIKFQGETDFETLDLFRAIPGSRLLHLAHNKHELTWVWGQ